MTPAEERIHRITIQQATKTGDASGQSIETWTEVISVWAKIKPIAGRELWLAKQAQARVTHRLNIVYMAGITSAMRATYRGRVFAFESVLNVDELNLELEILATEQV